MTSGPEVLARVVGRSHRGAVKSENQDRFLAQSLDTQGPRPVLEGGGDLSDEDCSGEYKVGPGGLLLFVADGMGGTAGGAAQEAFRDGTRKDKKRFGRRIRGKVLVIKSGQVAGFTQDNYRETPAQDMHPVLLPWEDTQERAFAFEGDAVFGG